MALNRRSFLAVLTVLLGYAVLTELQFACMNVDFAPSFVRTMMPDHPIRSFVDGQLGVIEPTYRHNYLFWAYRQLQGIGFTEEQQDELVPKPATVGSSPRGERTKSAAERWMEALADVGRQPTVPRGFAYGGTMRRVSGDQWQFYLNCPDAAFITATRTLEARAQEFGAKSPEVQEWLDAQETVFGNCREGAAIPKPAAAHLPVLIKADRNYQIAAAHFYAGNFDEAARRFEAIAEDASSPWSRWGRYLAARCFLRKGTLGADFGEVDAVTLREAAARFAAVIEDPKLSHLHESARGLLGYAQLRLEPSRTMKALSTELLTEDVSGLGDRWQDYDWLLDRGHGADIDDDMTDWLRTFRSRGPPSLEHALARWRETKSLPWLIALLAKIDADHEAVAEVLNGVAVPEASQGYLMATYHRLRLDAARGEKETVRAELDALLYAGDVAMSPSTRNHFLALRLQLAESFESFLRAAPREWVFEGFGFLGADTNYQVLLDADSLVVLNEQLPLRRLIEAAQSGFVPPHIREVLALATWVRAALIAEADSERAARALVSQYWPDLEGELAAYAAASDPQDKAFTLAYFLLRHPGARPFLPATVRRREPINETDQFRDNWWCRFDWGSTMHEAIYLKRGRQHPGPPDRTRIKLSFPPFLSDEDTQIAERQVRKLLAVPAGPNYLSQVVINWAKTHPEDERVPQALHLAVRSTRVGCVDEDTTKYSKAAYQQLHRRYPESEWARETKYWY